MDISSKKSRADLTAYFKKNSIPTAANFADFIGSTINQKDDGITKPPGDPISIEASTQIYKPALNIYEEFTDANPSWTIALASTTGNRGFALGNVPSNQVGIEARFFIELATGNVGIGTVAPADKLDIHGGVRAASAFVSGETTLGSTLDVTGAVTAKSTLNVTGAVNAAANITAAGAVNARSAAIVDNVAAGSATIANAVSAASISVKNALSAASITVGGAATAATVTVAGSIAGASATITNDVAAGSATIQNGITAQSATLKTNLQVPAIVAQSDQTSANLVLSGKGTAGAVKSTTAFLADSTVDIAGKLTAAGAVDITGALLAKATATVTGKVTAGALDVSGAVTLGASVDVTGKLTAAGSADLRSVARTNPNDHPVGRPLYVTGAITNTQGVEFRTSDAAQGLGFGPTTIYAAGTSATQDIILVPKGPSEAPGIVRVKSAVVVQGGLSVDSIAPQSAETNASLTLSGKGTGQLRLTSAIAATSTLDVTGKITASAGLEVAGVVAAKSTLDVTGKITALNALDITGAIVARSTLDVTGKITALNALEVTGAVVAKSTLDVTGKITAMGALDLRGSARTNTEFHPTGRPMYVTGAMTNSAGIEFRTSDASQGIGFGPTTIYAAGTAATQDLVLAPKGTSDAPGKVSITSGATISGTVTAAKASIQNAVEAGSASIAGLLGAGSVKIGSQGATATSIVDSITTSTPTTAIPTTSAMKDYVRSVLPGFSTNLSSSAGTELATVEAVKNYVDRAIPIGAILMWKGATIPDGWSLCNGSNNTPNLSDKFVLGRGNQDIGAVGGAATVALAVEHLPAHAHTATIASGGVHNHEFPAYHHNFKMSGDWTESEVKNTGAPIQPWPKTFDSGSHSHSITINNTGSGTAHNNMPPYYVLAYIMRTS